MPGLYRSSLLLIFSALFFSLQFEGGSAQNIACRSRLAIREWTGVVS
ncbi:hypothetical protein M3J09_004849 [Ascochyta lentis]